MNAVAANTVGLQACSLYKIRTLGHSPGSDFFRFLIKPLGWVMILSFSSIPMTAIVHYDHINIEFEPHFELLMMLADRMVAMSTNAFSPYFFFRSVRNEKLASTLKV